MNNFQGKRIWILGASSGIGRALAQELSSRGALLILSARRAEELKTLNAQMSDAHFVCPLDVRNSDSVHDALACIHKEYDRIDSVINLAALYEPSRLDDLNLAKTRLLIEVNLMGALNIIHAILPVFRSQGEGQIALCGSVAGFRGLPKGQPYSATKAAIINLSESLKAEHKNLDVKVINPGFVRTPLTEKNDFDMPMMIEPEEAAKAIAEGLLAQGFEIHFPKKMTWGMKLLRILPNRLYFSVITRVLSDKI